MITYKSKIGLELIVPVLIIIGSTTALMIYERVWIGLVINLLVIAFVGYMLLTTDYTIENAMLKIRSGLLFHTSVDITSISRITETRTPLSSPAASLDRLELRYNKFDSVIISPAKKSEFIAHILKINPRVEVKLRSPK